MVVGGGGVGNGGGAHAGLVGEHAPGHADAAGVHHGSAQEAAGGGGAGKGVMEDAGKGRRDLAGVEDQHHDSADNIEDCHEGHQDLRHAGDAGDAADDHQGGQQSHHDADGPQGDAEGAIDAGSQGVGLDAGADAEGGDKAEEREQNGQPLEAQAPGNVVHGAAHQLALLVGGAVGHRQRDLTVLDHHAHQGAEPQPEHGAGSAGGDGQGHAHNVAGADSGRQGGAHRLERGDIPLVLLGLVLLLEQGLGGVAHHDAEVAEDDALGDNQQEQARADHQHHHGNTPDHIVVQAREKCHKLFKHVLSSHPFSFFFFLLSRSIASGPWKGSAGVTARKHHSSLLA